MVPMTDCRDESAHDNKNDRGKDMLFFSPIGSNVPATSRRLKVNQEQALALSSGSTSEGEKSPILGLLHDNIQRIESTGQETANVQKLKI